MLTLFTGLVSLMLMILGLVVVLASGSGFVFRVYLAAIFAAGIGAIWLRRRRLARTASAASWLARMRPAAVSLCAVLAVGDGFALLASLVSYLPPAQAALATRLRAHRAELERLREMVASDRIMAVLDQGAEFARDGVSFQPPDRIGLAPERQAEYERLMRAAGCRRIDVWPEGTVVFAVASWGMANTGWRVNLAWSPAEPSPLSPTIDGVLKARPQDADHAFSRLDGHWYAHIVW